MTFIRHRRASFAPSPQTARPCPRLGPLAALVLALAVIAAPVRAKVFSPETFTLDNGMQVVVISNHRAPVVTHMVWYKVGSADEQSGYSGIAHFLEHLMFKGTKTRAPGEFSKIVAENGGQENAFTSYDYTAYHQTIAREHLETMMAMEADRMTNLVLTDEIIEPERQVVREERRMRTDNNPSAILGEHVSESLYRNYPYRRPIIGYDHEIVAMTRKNIIDFYKHWYAPNNAILVVAGDITAKELKPLAEKYYGVIPRGPKIDRLRPAEPPQEAARIVAMKHTQVRQPSWRRSYIAPSYLYGETEHADALQVLTEILGGGGTSRLYRKLVIDDKLAVGAGSHYSPDSRGPTQFMVYASPRPGVTLPQVEAAVQAEIDKIEADGVTADEVARAKKRMLAGAVFARDSFTAGAQTLGAALAVGQKVADVEAWPERIAAVTADQIKAAAKFVFVKKHSVTAFLMEDKEPKE
ncbi:MAG: peptidase M16 [Rhodospirillaceae bacterium]|nr:peptidase M16 [Rhodospirillaceae bacterium]